MSTAMTLDFPANVPLATDQILQALRRCNEVARQAMAEGHHPFGALLLAPDGVTVLDTQGNVDTVNHAESVLVRRAAAQYDADYLWACTLVSNAEPCAMCAGTQYWGNIGRLIYGISETRLLALTGDHGENPTMALPCRTVFASGQKPVEVIGPVEAIEDEVVAMHRDFWPAR